MRRVIESDKKKQKLVQIHLILECRNIKTVEIMFIARQIGQRSSITYQVNPINLTGQIEIKTFKTFGKSE